MGIGLNRPQSADSAWRIHDSATWKHKCRPWEFRAAIEAYLPAREIDGCRTV